MDLQVQKRWLAGQPMWPVTMAVYMSIQRTEEMYFYRRLGMWMVSWSMCLTSLSIQKSESGWLKMGIMIFIDLTGRERLISLNWCYSHKYVSKPIGDASLRGVINIFIFCNGEKYAEKVQWRMKF